MIPFDLAKKRVFLMDMDPDLKRSVLSAMSTAIMVEGPTAVLISTIAAQDEALREAAALLLMICRDGSFWQLPDRITDRISNLRPHLDAHLAGDKKTPSIQEQMAACPKAKKRVELASEKVPSVRALEVEVTEPGENVFGYTATYIVVPGHIDISPTGILVLPKKEE